MTERRAIVDAIERGDLNEVKRLIEGSPLLLSEPGEDNMTPLHIAAREGQSDIAAWLVAHGANLEAIDSRHRATPLNWAAYMAREATVRLLLELGADAKRENAYGKTPYQVAEMGAAGDWRQYAGVEPDAYRPVLEVLHRHGAADTQKPPTG